MATSSPSERTHPPADREEHPAVDTGVEDARVDDAEATAGPALLWFAVLGGSIAWVLHLLVSWLVVELGCAQPRHHLLGLSLRTVTAIATALPALLALASLVVAVLTLRTLRRNGSGVGRRRSRAHFMAEVAIGLDGLALLMIIFGGAAVASLGVCAR